MLAAIYILCLVVQVAGTALNVGRPGNDSGLLGAKLAFKGEVGLCVLTLGSSSSVTLFPDAPVLQFSYDPKERRMFAVVKGYRRFHGIKWTDFNSSLVNSVEIELGRSSCPYSTTHSGVPFTPNVIASIEFDWVANNMYVSTICGELNVCNIVSHRCVKLRDLGEPGHILVKTFPERGLMFWIEAKLSAHEAESVKVTALSFIFQANMDGTSLEIAATGMSEFRSFVGDHDTARLYWTYQSGRGIWEYDIDEKMTRQLAYGSITSTLHVHFASRGAVYFQETRGQSIYRETADGRNFSQVYSVKSGTAAVFATPWTELTPKLVENPCESHNCSHLCALSGPGRAGCACEPGFGLSLDAVTCVETALLISKEDGIFRSPFHNLSLLVEWGLDNILRPRKVTHDPASGTTFWVEEDVTARTSRLLTHSVAGKLSILVNFTFGNIRDGSQELEAIAVDSFSGNIYMALGNERRLRVCNTTKHLTCTEILGNQVEDSVKGLVLHHQTGNLFWAETVTVNEEIRLRIFKAGMDGSRIQLIRNSSWPMAYNGYLYWAGAWWAPDVRKSVDGKAGIFRARLTQTGVQFEGCKEDLLTGNLTAVTGLAVYHFSARFSETSVRGPNGTCENRTCPGICLLSGADSFVCVCPEGQMLNSNRTSCRKDPQYPMIMVTNNGSIQLRNESGTIHIDWAEKISGIAYDGKRNNSLWIEENHTLHLASASGNDGRARRRLHFKLSLVEPDVPIVFEYDWIGDNIFFQIGAGLIYAFSLRTAAFAALAQNSTTKRDATKNEGIGLALDPPRGKMYWLGMGAIFRGQMDGSDYERLEVATTGNSVVAVHVDQVSGSLYWARGTMGTEGVEVVYAGPNGQRPTVLIRLAEKVTQLHTAGDNVLWLSSPSQQLFSCRKFSSDGLKMHDFGTGEKDRFQKFSVLHSDIQTTEENNPCAGNICSHICVPTPTGYMRCLCPAGLDLFPDGWTCGQISAGMEHLTAKQIVHGDLAARNVLVFPGNVVKLADFGMSRQLYGCAQYQTKKPQKLPWKWASPELLSSGEFSEASDVWAFGVTAWEIYSLGEVPYKVIMRFDQQFVASLQMGMRLQKPASASDGIYKIMLECWSAERSSRPTFATLRRLFHEQASQTQSKREAPVCSSADGFYVTVV